MSKDHNNTNMRKGQEPQIASLLDLVREYLQKNNPQIGRQIEERIKELEMEKEKKAQETHSTESAGPSRNTEPRNTGQAESRGGVTIDYYDTSKPVVCMGEGPDFSHPKLPRKLREGEVFIDLEGKDLSYIQESVSLKKRLQDVFFGDLRFLNEMELLDYKLRGIISEEEMYKEMERRGFGNREQIKKEVCAIAGIDPQKWSEEFSSIKPPEWVRKRNWETFVPFPRGRVVEEDYKNGYLIVEKEPPKPLMEEKYARNLLTRPLTMILKKPHVYLDTVKSPYLYSHIKEEAIEQGLKEGTIRERISTVEGVNLILGEVREKDSVPGFLWRTSSKIEMDSRPTGSGKTQEAIVRLGSYNIKKEDENVLKYAKELGILKDKPSFCVNLYVAPNLNTKSRVFSEIKDNTSILKGKDSRIFREIRPSPKKIRSAKESKGKSKEETKETKETKELTQVDWIYRKAEKGGLPVLAGILGKNTMFYSFLLVRELRSLGIPFKVNITLDDFVPNLAITLLPVLKRGKGGEREFARDEWTDFYHANVLERFIKAYREDPEKLRKYHLGEIPGIDGMDDEKFGLVKRLVWNAQVYLLSCEEPFYIREPVRSGYCFSPERMHLMFVYDREPVVSSPEEFWATVNLLEWLVLRGRKIQLITPNKPRAQRALSSEEEFGAETLFRLIAYLQLLVMYRDVAWVREAIDRVIESKEPVVLSDVEANTLVAMSMVAAGMDVHITDGTAVLSGGGFIYHNRAGYVLAPETNEHGKFKEWKYEGFYNEEEQKAPVQDVWIDVDRAISPYPVIQGGIKTFRGRTGLDVKRVRFTLGKSTVEPIMSIKRIIIPQISGQPKEILDQEREEWKLQPNVYLDLMERYERLQRGEPFGDFKRLREIVRSSSSLSLVRNLHVIARSRRILQDYDKKTKVARLEEDVRIKLGEDEKTELLSIYATVFLAELLRRYAYFDDGDPSRVRIVLDPRILNMVSRTPVRWVENEELREDFSVISRFLPGMISQANRGRTDKAVRGHKTAVVIWLTSVDPLYEKSHRFKHFVALSEINQTLGRFVHRGEDTAKEIVLVFLGGGRSGFFLNSIASLFHILHICYLDWEKIYLMEADRIGFELVDEMFHYEDTPEGSRVLSLLGRTDDEVIEEVERTRKKKEEEEKAKAEEGERGKEKRTYSPGRIFSDQFHDPLSDAHLYFISKEDIERAKRAERYRKEAEEVDKRLAERMRERALVENLRYTLSEEFGLETSISDPRTLNKLIEQIMDLGKVPDWARDKVWKILPEEHNPYLDGWSED